jgi:hypothetical protein
MTTDTAVSTDRSIGERATAITSIADQLNTDKQHEGAVGTEKILAVVGIRHGGYPPPPEAMQLRTGRVAPPPEHTPLVFSIGELVIFVWDGGWFHITNAADCPAEPLFIREELRSSLGGNRRGEA